VAPEVAPPDAAPAGALESFRQQSIPRRLLSHVGSLLRRLRRGPDWPVIWRRITSRRHFNPFNPRELDPILNARGVPLLAPACVPDWQDRHAIARYVLTLYARSPNLRRRFPRALSEGPDGLFCRWLLLEVSRLGLPPGADAAVRDLLACNYGARVARIWEIRYDVREKFPYALTPHQRAAFLEWLLIAGPADYGLHPEEALWHIFELEADPSCGLARTYRYTPAWQRQIPHGLSSAGWDDLRAFVAREIGHRPSWLKRARLPKMERAEQNGQGGVNVIGYFRYTSGLQQAALTMAAALERAGVATSLRDVPVMYLRDLSDRRGYGGLEQFNTTLVNMPIDVRAERLYERAALSMRPNVRRVAMAWWELEQVPPRLAAWAADYDEIWAPTRFVADAVRGITTRPVRTLLPGLELPPIPSLGREHFELNPHACTFLFVFDFNSRMPRKNPLGLIRAFRAAFLPSEPAELVIKVSAGDTEFTNDRRELHESAARASVRVIDRILSRPELLALTATADAYVSLHRSEGFGLTIAEAMLLGRPTIATGYSGNLDFMAPGTGLLVDYTKVPIAEDVPPYPKGFLWAEPSIEHAASLMRWVFDHPAEARALGERGRAHAWEVLALEAYGRRLASGLRTA
jgi:glycosyltransferase involved in cell wall biosynthesis